PEGCRALSGLFNRMDCRAAGRNGGKLAAVWETRKNIPQSQCEFLECYRSEVRAGWMLLRNSRKKSRNKPRNGVTGQARANCCWRSWPGTYCGWRQHRREGGPTWGRGVFSFWPPPRLRPRAGKPAAGPVILRGYSGGY